MSNLLLVLLTYSEQSFVAACRRHRHTGIRNGPCQVITFAVCVLGLPGIHIDTTLVSCESRDYWGHTANIPALGCFGAHSLYTVSRNSFNLIHLSVSYHPHYPLSRHNPNNTPLKVLQALIYVYDIACFAN